MKYNINTMQQINKKNVFAAKIKSQHLAKVFKSFAGAWPSKKKTEKKLDGKLLSYRQQVKKKHEILL